MRKKIEDQTLIPHYPASYNFDTSKGFGGSWVYGDLPNPAGGRKIPATGDITLRDEWKFLDQRDRFGRRPHLDPAPNMEELLNDLDQYPENVWNIEWLQKNDPKIDANEPDPYYRYGNSVLSSFWSGNGLDANTFGYSMPFNMFPWNGREPKLNPIGANSGPQKDIDGALSYQPSISNIQPWRKVDYESREFTLNDIPYLIDQVPELANPPHSDKELIITSLSL